MLPPYQSLDTYQVVLNGSDVDRRLPPLPLVHEVSVQAVGLRQRQGLLVLFALDLRTMRGHRIVTKPPGSLG